MHNTNNFPPNINPQIYALSAVLVGACLVDDFSASEQSSIGNWLMLVSQYIITHGAQQNLIESRIDNKNININSRQFKKGGSHYHNNKSNQNVRDEIEYLTLAIKKIYDELEKIKNENYEVNPIFDT